MLSLLLNVSFFVMLSVVKLNGVRQNVVMLNDVMLCHYAQCCNPVSRYPDCGHTERHGNSKATQNINIQPNLTRGLAQTPIFLIFGKEPILPEVTAAIKTGANLKSDVTILQKFLL